MRLELIEGIRLLIIATIVYIPTVTLSGWFTARVAKSCGDDLPEQLGFLTLHPFAHVSMFGYSLLLLGEFFGNYLTFLRHLPGFGRFILVDPQPYNGYFKAFCDFFSRGFAHLLLFTSAIAVGVLYFKATWFMPSSLAIGTVTPLVATTKDILLYFLRQNIRLCAVYTVLGIINMICFIWNIPRFISTMYFVISLAAFLTLGYPVDYCLHVYIQAVHNLLVGLVHG